MLYQLSYVRAPVNDTTAPGLAQRPTNGSERGLARRPVLTRM